MDVNESMQKYRKSPRVPRCFFPLTLHFILTPQRSQFELFASILSVVCFSPYQLLQQAPF